MISFINGTVEYISDSFIMLENNGIGYRIFVSPNTISKTKLNSNLKIFTYMNVKEDSITLFGFLTMEEINVFNLLLSVSGIGPKLAVSIINTLSPSKLYLSILTDDFNTLNKCPGVGKKTAQRMVLELKDKVKTNDNIMTSQDDEIQDFSVGTNNQKQDAIEALSALGYNRSDTLKAVMEVSNLDMTTEQIIKLALKKLSGK